MYKVLLLVIISIAFPYEVKAMGLSAGPISIFLIYGLYVLLVLNSVLRDKTVWFTKAELYLILLYAVSGIFTLIGGTDLLNSIRFFYIYGSGFVLIAIMYRYRLQICDFHKYRNDLILCFIIICMVNIVVGVLMFKSPSFGGSYLSLMNIADYYEVRSTEGTYFRLGTPITGPEATAEMVILLAPLILFYTIVKKQYWCSILLLVALQALMQTATRSGVLLTGLNIIFLLFAFNIYLKDVKLKFINLAIPFTVIAYLGTNPEILQTIFYRFTEISSGSNSSFAEQLNRGTVWNNALLAISNSMIIGHGFTRYTEGDYTNFHSLYLTTVFQFGLLLGLILIFGLFYLLVQLFKTYKFNRISINEKILALTLFLSFGAFLVNEFKYEFNRFPSYMLLIYLYFYICIETVKGNKCPKQ